MRKLAHTQTSLFFNLSSPFIDYAGLHMSSPPDIEADELAAVVFINRNECSHHYRGVRASLQITFNTETHGLPCKSLRDM